MFNEAEILVWSKKITHICDFNLSFSFLKPVICNTKTDLINIQADSINENIFVNSPISLSSKTVTNLSYTRKKITGKKGVKIASSNVRSLLPKIEEIRHILLNTEIDVLCINESWLDKNISDDNVSILGYRIYRCDRNRTGGGVCIYVKKHNTKQTD